MYIIQQISNESHQTFEVEGAILTLSQILITNLQGSICVHEATRGEN